MKLSLEEVKRIGKEKESRIFIAGNYQDTRSLGLLEKMAFWVESFNQEIFYPVMMKNFKIPRPGEEPDWFKDFLVCSLPDLMEKECFCKLPQEERNEIASTIYLLDNCGHIFIELTTLGGGGMIPEAYVAYLKGLPRYIFKQQGHGINVALRALFTGLNEHEYSDEGNLKQLINTVLRSICAERTNR